MKYSIYELLIIAIFASLFILLSIIAVEVVYFVLKHFIMFLLDNNLYFN
jgi:hypothetical protein